MENYKQAYAKLNEQQKKAVDTIDGPVLVIAGPGTGKTQLLSMRVANILNQTDTEPQNVLCLTFTNKAALNMRERLSQLAGSDARKVEVKTFHSFAAQIMNQYPDYFWNGARLSVASEAVQVDIIQTILSSLPLDNPLATTFAGNYTALGSVKEALKLAKEAGLTPDELRSALKQNLKYIDKVEPKLKAILAPSLSVQKLSKIQHEVESLPKQKLEQTNLLLPLDQVIQESLQVAIDQDLPTNKTLQTSKWKRRWIQSVNGEKGMFAERKRTEWWIAVCDVYEAYRQHLHKRGYYDYADMLIEVLEQLQSQPGMIANIQERYLYVLIDEFQDTNAAQLRLARMVVDHYAANNSPNLMAVGDDDQAIFAFNGAELNNMLSFKRYYPDTKLIVLSNNYRSTQPILDTAAQIIDQAEDRLVNREPSITKQLSSTNPSRGKFNIAHLSYPTRGHQFAAVAGQIQQLWDSDQKDIAVVARTHDSLRQLASALVQKGISVRYEQQGNILEQESIRQVHLIAKTAVAIAEGDRSSVNEGIAATVRHPMWKFNGKILWKLATDNYSSPDWLGSLLDSRDEALNHLGNWLVWLSRNSDNLPLPLIMEHIVGLSKSPYLLSPFRDYYLKLRATTSSYLETLSATYLLTHLVQEFADNQTTLTDFVNFIELNLNTKRVIADESWFVSGEKAVQLLTIHKAKGLEFDTVFLVDAIESMWQPRTVGRSSPANLRLQSYGESEDDYVRLLYVAASRARQNFIAASYFSDDKGDKLLPTPLLSNMPLTIVDESLAEPVQILEQGIRWPNLKSKDEKALLQEKLDNFELSPTAFIEFLNVAEAGPLNFKERQLLRLPHPSSPQGSYGTAIHAALETAQRLVNTSKLSLNPVLDRFESALIDAHMSPNDFDRYMIRGEKILPKLLAQADLLLPKGGLVEQRIDSMVVGKAHIKGNIDRIDQADNELMISDYKTGKPLHSFSTKDQTKAVKAWRHQYQLLFYALLVQESTRFKAKNIQTQMLYVEAEQPKNISLSLTPNSEELDRLRKLINKVWTRIMKLNFPDVRKYPQTIEGINQFEEDLLNDRV